MINVASFNIEIQYGSDEKNMPIIVLIIIIQLYMLKLDSFPVVLRQKIGKLPWGCTVDILGK